MKTKTSTIFSANSHTIEPGDLWVNRVDKRYRERAPRVIKNHQEKLGSFLVAEGPTPFPIGGGFAAGKSPKDLATSQ